MSTESGPRPVARVVGQGTAAVPLDVEVPSDNGSPAATAEMSDEDALDRIFSARATYQRAEEEVYVKSVEMNITIRELTQRELDDIFEMFEERNNPRARKKRRPSEINAYLVARALVKPDFSTQKAAQKLQEMYGTPSLTEAIPKIFKPLEVIAIAERVLDLSGGGDDAVTAARNL